MTTQEKRKSDAAKSRKQFTNREAVFVSEYLRCWNASEAYRRAGYDGKNANVLGPRMLANVGIRAEIERRISEKAMQADEVLVRLAAHARGDLSPFLVDGATGIDLALDSARANIGIVKKYRVKHGVTKSGEPWEEREIELYDAQAALVHIGRHLGLFTDKQEITAAVASQDLTTLDAVQRRARINQLLDIARTRRDNGTGGSGSASGSA